MKEAFIAQKEVRDTGYLVFKKHKVYHESKIKNWFLSEISVSNFILLQKYPDNIDLKELFGNTMQERGLILCKVSSYYMYKAEPKFFTPKLKNSVPRRPTMHQKFIDFLKENNALIPFCTNLAITNHFSKSMSLTEYLNKNTDVEYYILGKSNIQKIPFIWIETTEGLEYWSKLSRLWKHYICN